MELNAVKVTATFVLSTGIIAIMLVDEQQSQRKKNQRKEGSLTL